MRLIVLSLLFFVSHGIMATIPRTVGFLGVGTINAAVCRGLATLDEGVRPSKILLSPRGAAKAAELAADFPGLCVVCATNQEVLDADLVFVATLPDQAGSVCSELKFREAQIVVSLMAGIDHEKVCAMVAPVPASRVSRAIPLPPVKDHAGVTILYPPATAAGAATAAVFAALGTAVPCADEAMMATLQVGTAMMGAYYAQLRAMAGWMAARGVPAAAANTYVGALMHSVAGDAAAAGAAGFDALIAEQTPGGYNEMGIKELTEAGVLGEIALTMDSIDARWQGRPYAGVRLGAAPDGLPAAKRD
jgi:pyrroline-5-carboxylate reductase